MTFLLFPKLYGALTGTIFWAVSLVQQTVTRELKVMREGIVGAWRVGTILSESIAKHSFSALCLGLMVSGLKLNCHTPYPYTAENFRTHVRLHQRGI
jgi:hypothetical protein